ncbi:uncharacterized protein At1g76070 [Gossypium raimondii]|uniref:Uncharacterized protein n=1 Tax=Gossypium raimondii TaxID=29730 RepID=A0A0D2PPP6_GOSRA|nr:uncharacterized protein At1g76070 [Gossypium raimondii]KJB48277.1 hypothetical protein B456_008G061700 [Gossypium raimondii]MBA0591987.1 hypothetical protein [Gossypium raimondii]
MDKLVVKVKQRKILSFLPKLVSSPAVLTFQVSPPISPVGKGSSSSAPTIVSLIPKGAPRKSRNGSFDAREPASPKVSCIGQIKRNKKKKQAASKSKLPSPPPQVTCAEQVKGKQASKVTKHGHKIAEGARVPSLGQTKQFSSPRGTLSDFDWETCDQAAGFVTNPLYEEKVVANVNGVKESRNTKLWSRRTSTRLTPLQL